MQHINTVNGLYKLWICREAYVCVTQDDRFISRNTYNSIAFSINFINVINYEKMQFQFILEKLLLNYFA